MDPRKVCILLWWEGQKIFNNGPDTLGFFADRGFNQVLAAYYDADIETNYAQWQEAAQGVEGIYGALFASWKDDYSKLKAFGDLWW